MANRLKKVAKQPVFIIRMHSKNKATRYHVRLGPIANPRDVYRIHDYIEAKGFGDALVMLDTKQPKLKKSRPVKVKTPIHVKPKAKKRVVKKKVIKQSKPKLSKAKSNNKKMYLQVAAFKDKKHANVMRNRLTQATKLRVAITTAHLKNGQSLYNVRVGPFANAKKIYHVHDDLQTKGFGDSLVILR